MKKLLSSGHVSAFGSLTAGATYQYSNARGSSLGAEANH
jgi:hypothetical protein